MLSIYHLGSNIDHQMDDPCTILWSSNDICCRFPFLYTHRKCKFHSIHSFDGSKVKSSHLFLCSSFPGRTLWCNVEELDSCDRSQRYSWFLVHTYTMPMTELLDPNILVMLDWHHIISCRNEHSSSLPLSNSFSMYIFWHLLCTHHFPLGIQTCLCCQVWRTS